MASGSVSRNRALVRPFQARLLLQSLLSYRVLAVLVVVVAALVRLWRLDFHSFWLDEAISLRWATSDISFIWEKTFPLVEEKHPPAYYTLLHGWLRLLAWVGLHESDAAIRSLGAGLGVITTWATLRLATRVSGPATGLLTGALVALSPVLIWYSQEARMFQPATTGILLAAWGLYSAWFSPRMGVRLAWWLLMVGGLLFALYSYLFSAFMLPAVGLSVLLLYRAAPDRRRFLEGLAALALVTLLFMPLAQNAWGVNAAESTPGRAFENFWDNHVDLLKVLTVWRVAWPSALTHTILAVWGLLLLIGIIPRFPRGKTLQATPQPQHRQARDPHPSSFSLHPSSLAAVWLWLWLGTPLLIANIMLSRSGSIFDEDRYLIFLTPFVLWAVARGVVTVASAVNARLQPATFAFLAAGAILTLGAALPQVWSPANHRENWRAAALYIIDYTRATPELSGAVVSHIDYTNVAFQWYLRQAFSHDEMPVFFPFGGWIDPALIEENVAPPLRGIEELGVDTLWLVQAHTQYVDPDQLVEGWLQETYPIVTELYPTGVKVTGHVLAREYVVLPGPASQTNTPIEAAPELHVYRCAPLFDPVAATDALYHPPSGWVHVQTWWSAAMPLDEDYQLRARVIGPRPGGNRIWGESLDRPADPFRIHPTSAWTPGRFVRAELDINLNPITPPGNYEIELILESETNTFTVPCGTVRIQ
jgi:hypothetical protein